MNSLIRILPFVLGALALHVPRDGASNYKVTSIPGMPFMGTTYAGLMPISPGNSTEYFFWYVPTDDGNEDDLVWSGV